MTMINDSKKCPTDGPLKDALEGQMQIEPKFTKTSSMKAPLK
jgi:hypothetical protein